MKPDNTDDLRHLGSKVTPQFDEPCQDILDTFENQYLKSDYIVEFVSEEFTSLCPKTGQPDFARIEIRYVPRFKCIESKSLKLYLFAYRNYGSFMETITNKMLQDFVNVCQPWAMVVRSYFKARGGIEINVEATYPSEENAEENGKLFAL
jgi:7-cyano-7-deazaguanine reductase